MPPLGRVACLLMVVACARSAPQVQSAPSTAAAIPLPAVSPAPRPTIPFDTTAGRPEMATMVGNAGLASRSLQPGVLGSRTNPIQANGASGQQDYLRRLKCPTGPAPRFVRNGSLGSRNPGDDGHIIDVYSVECPEVGAFLLYMDMYHPVRMMEAVPGFTLLPELPARLATGCPPQVSTDPDSNATWVFRAGEVATPPQPVTPLVTMLSETGASVGTQQVTFIVDTLGAVEPASIKGGVLGASDRLEVARQMLLALRFTPAEHHPGCRVRMQLGLTLRVQS